MRICPPSVTVSTWEGSLESPRGIEEDANSIPDNSSGMSLVRNGCKAGSKNIYKLRLLRRKYFTCTMMARSMKTVLVMCREVGITPSSWN